MATFTLAEGGNYRLAKYSGQAVEILDTDEERRRNVMVCVRAADGHIFGVLASELT